jgi:DNA-binding MarR family transcriptional regulator
MIRLNDYLSFSANLKELIEKFDLNDRDCRLLEYLAANSLQGGLCTITELIYQKQIGSPAVLHSSLKKMIKFGFIYIELNQEDHRIKYPKLTSKADKFFDEVLKEFSIKQRR